ncbi:DUF934 domain-containing protein [Roseicitreum antarcticum]|uniref:Oxidoreductase n=1 Tax=Roseicitreum antarcticum TaxID=564137 RepID=A0A1H2QMI1_9RHOB|nr:DUF934 domain-containing protein [Roseicitreum antarcticum]SDW08407.1 protein of unknown function [Roseicitreum antarcticum]
MSVVIDDHGFGVADLAESLRADQIVDLAPDADAAALTAAVTAAPAMIRVAFPAFSDGRGFTLGRQLRRLGYAGRLRASGHVLADQYAMARRSGFDEVAISDSLAQRQPAADWHARSQWQALDYQSRLRRPA